MYIEIPLIDHQEKPTFGQILSDFYHGLCTDSEAVQSLKEITSEPEDVAFWIEQLRLIPQEGRNS